ncbi:MAG: Rab family GTPase [Candidatus Hodarchaeota archaeon]
MSNDSESEIFIEHKYFDQYKICLLGDGLVGKTTILRKYCGKPLEYNPTAGADITHRKIKISNKELSAIFWDLSGQPVFKNVRRVYYQGAHACVYVFDVTRRDTFINIIEWMKETQKNIGKPPSILVGNKIDLIDERKVDSENGQFFEDNLNIKYYETSAIDGTGVNELFRTVIRAAIDGRDSTLP